MILSKELKNVSNRLSVLYVEDDAEERVRLGEIFEIFFGKVHVADNGKSGLELFEHHPIDLIITDLSMPVMDGSKMLEEMYRRGSDVPTIVMTAHHTSEYLISTLDLQVDGVLLKPVDMEKMLHLLYKVCHKIINDKIYRDLDNTIAQWPGCISNNDFPERADATAESEGSRMPVPIESLQELREKTKQLDLLYVEDDADSRERMGTLFSSLFRTVTVAGNGEEGWKYYQSGAYHLVVTDINMPKMNGIELLKQIKNTTPAQKVILVSAYDTVEHLFAAIREGADDFLLKPVEADQFKVAIDKIAVAIQNEKCRHDYQQKLEEEVIRKTEELISKAMTDDLTGLHNRKKLSDDIQDSGVKILMLVNIDNFDNINAIYGYASGDIILRRIADIFKEHLHPKAKLYRIGSDEFVFLFRELSLSEAESYANHLKQDVFSEPILYEAMKVYVSSTIVLAEGEEDLLKNTHIAFKETRAIGKNRIGIYRGESEFERRQQKTLNNIIILSDVMLRQNVIPYFQPIVDNQTLQVKKYECLARIVHEHKVLPPSEFIEAAELAGYLPELTRMIINKSFEYLRSHTAEFSINISESDLNDGYLVSFLDEKLSYFGIDPNMVTIEVLEGISAHGAEKSLDQLQAFKKRGLKLAIDDFGAQNSNFERVYRLNVDYIKIDGRFIKHLDSDANSYHVVKTITDFSKSIGAKVVAEFVHSREILDRVVELGIDYSQGYYFSEPKPTIEE